MTDYYQILGIDRNASAEMIKNAYRDKIRANHPDLGGDEEKAKEINLAFEILSDEQKRQNYDLGGKIPNFDNFGGFKFNFDDLFNNTNTFHFNFGGFQQTRIYQYTVNVPLYILVCGGDIEINCPRGNFRLNIHPNTRPGATITVDKNDCKVIFSLIFKYPDGLNDEQKDILKKLGI